MEDGNLVNSDTKETCDSVRTERALSENVTDADFIDIKTKAKMV